MEWFEFRNYGKSMMFYKKDDAEIWDDNDRLNDFLNALAEGDTLNKQEWNFVLSSGYYPMEFYDWHLYTYGKKLWIYTTNIVQKYNIFLNSIILLQEV